MAYRVTWSARHQRHTIVSDEDGQVTFRVKDYKNGGDKTTLTIPGEEFVRRFSLHILPPRMMRVRYAGWLGSNVREVNLATARTALKVADRSAIVAEWG